MKKTAVFIVFAIWILLGVTRIYAGFALFDFLGLNFALALIMAVAVGWIPVAGSILAITGAVRG